MSKLERDIVFEMHIFADTGTSEWNIYPARAFYGETIGTMDLSQDERDKLIWHLQYALIKERQKRHEFEKPEDIRAKESEARLLKEIEKITKDPAKK